MTSQLSRADVEEAIWRAGIRSNAVVQRLMRVIDSYAMEIARKSSLPQVTVIRLSPGEYDDSREVTCCIACGGIKGWFPDFHLDKNEPSGHSLTCKTCTRKEKEAGHSSRDGWRCSKCRERKPPEEFPQEKRDRPRRPVECNACREKISGND